MAMGTKTLMGMGKLVVGAGGKVAKTGARIFGDDAVKAVGRGVGKAQGAMDDVVKRAVKQDEIYKAAKAEARGVKEAASSVSDAAKDAVNKTSGTMNFVTPEGTVYQRVKNPHWKEGNPNKTKSHGGTANNQWLYTKDGKSINGQEFGKAKQSFIQNGGTVEAAEIAQEAAESGAGAFDGIPSWAKGAGLVAAGGIAGAMLSDDD